MLHDRFLNAFWARPAKHARRAGSRLGFLVSNFFIRNIAFPVFPPCCHLPIELNSNRCESDSCFSPPFDAFANPKSRRNNQFERFLTAILDTPIVPANANYNQSQNRVENLLPKAREISKLTAQTRPLFLNKLEGQDRSTHASLIPHLRERRRGTKSRKQIAETTDEIYGTDTIGVFPTQQQKKIDREAFTPKTKVHSARARKYLSALGDESSRAATRAESATAAKL